MKIGNWSINTNEMTIGYQNANGMVSHQSISSQDLKDLKSLVNEIEIPKQIIGYRIATFLRDLNDNTLFHTEEDARLYVKTFALAYYDKDIPNFIIEPIYEGEMENVEYITRKSFAEDEWTEFCPHCDKEIHLPFTKFIPQPCPCCNNVIFPCNNCRHQNCDNCPFNRLFTFINITTKK